MHFVSFCLLFAPGSHSGGGLGGGLFPHAVPGTSANQKDPPQHYTVQVFRYAVPEPSATQKDLAQHHGAGWSLAHRRVHANNAKVIWMARTHTHPMTFASLHRRTKQACKRNNGFESMSNSSGALNEARLQLSASKQPRLRWRRTIIGK